MKSTRLRMHLKYFLIFSILICAQFRAISQVTISGKVTTENGTAMPGIAIYVSGTENKMEFTDNNGNYSIALQQGGSYDIRPLDCPENPLNGVTTYDRVLIDRHIQGIELLSPYKLIAADVDDSGNVDLTDIDVTFNLILGIITEFPGDNLKYVLKSYVFPDPLDPFHPAFPRNFTVANLQTSMIDIDFIGVKSGDVNNTAVLVDGCSAELPSLIAGNVTRDQIPNCQPDAGETPLAGWLVTASNADNTFYGTTNASGYYSISLVPGTYDVSIQTPNDLWNPCIDTVYNVAVSLMPNVAVVDFQVQPGMDCPSLEVDLSIPLLRRCFSNIYNVKYCNKGTSVAENTRVELDLDPFFMLTSSSVPNIHLGGNTYSFDLGNVPSGQCGNFSIIFTLSCDAVLGQSHCTEARIYPDTSCNPAASWSGPDLKVQGECTGDEVKFTISNLGSNMLEPSSYIVIEDIVVMVPPIQNPFVLASGVSEVITFPANGKTMRMEVNQPAGHPWSDKASATVEGCGTNASGGFSMGMVNLFTQNDQSPTIDVDCRENTGSFDPNDKQGIPLGVLAEHYIPLHQPIEYMIRFQNTGTDTAFTVIVRDTLDAALDATSIRALGSSHPYTFNLSGEGVAQFVFTNIMLPDSNINEAASHGYVKFVIEPKQGVQEGVVVKNSAAIYFDFNEPVITNTTWHTFGTKFLGTSAVLFKPNVALDVFPNPTSDQLNFLIKSPTPLSGLLQLFDVAGKQVATEKFEHNAFTFNAKGLKAGYYTYTLSTKAGVLAAGKVVVMQ